LTPVDRAQMRHGGRASGAVQGCGRGPAAAARPPLPLSVRPPPSKLLASRLLLAGLAFTLAACTPQGLVVRGMADGLAAQGQMEEEDLELAREAAAFYLKLSESVLRQTPGHLPLAESVASGFTQYAFAFVSQGADELQPRDARAAQRLRERAARLYRRAQRHAMAALENRQPGFARALAGATGANSPKLAAEEVAVAYWAAAAWGAHIALSKDRPDVVADLPLAVRLARLAYERSPEHGQGALASLMGTFEAARAGGSRAQALVYFERAEAAAVQAGEAGPGSAAVLLARAEALALSAGDRAAFEALLRRALVASEGRQDLNNQVMRQRAQWLLANLDDLF